MSLQHRFMPQIEAALDSGFTQCILYGENVRQGEWFYTLETGSIPLQKSLATHLLQEYKHVILVENHRLGCFEYPSNSRKRAEFRPFNNANDLEKHLLPETEDSGNNPFGNIDRSAIGQSNTDTPEAMDQLTADPSIKVSEAISRLGTMMREQGNKLDIAIIVNGVDWIARLFPQQEHCLAIIEELTRWQSEKFPSFLIIPNLEILTTYMQLNEDRANMIYIGTPPAHELEAALRHTVFDKRVLKRLVQKKLPNDEGTDQINTMSLGKNDIARIASALKMKGLLLKNAINFTVRACNAWLSIEKQPESFCDWFCDRLGVSVENIKWDDVILPESCKQSIDSLFRKFLDGYSASMPKGLLLYGPPGTGKTHIAKALANRGGCTFTGLKLADLKGRYVGESGKNVQRIFAEARASSPTLIFIDEIDTIFQARGSGNQDSFSNDIVNQFLAEVDGVDTGKQRIFIVASTNRPELVDSAVKSRLASMEIPLPDKNNIQIILKQHLNGSSLASGEMDELVERCIGLSGRDLKTLSGDIISALSAHESRPVDIAMSKMRKRVSESIGAAGYIKLIEDNPVDGLQAFYGFGKAKADLKCNIDSILNPHDVLVAEGCISNGILLDGPPGNGKTFFVSCLAKECELDFLRISGSELAAPTVDDTIRTIDQLINSAIRLSVTKSGVLIFFDEFDAIASKEALTPKLRAALLGNLDRLHNTAKVVLIAATNHKNRLDEAVIRSGRFDYHHHFGNPDTNTIIEILQGFMKDSQFTLETSPEEIEKLAHSWNADNRTVADISSTIKVAKQLLVRKSPQEPYILKTEHLEEARALCETAF